MCWDDSRHIIDLMAGPDEPVAAERGLIRQIAVPVAIAVLIAAVLGVGGWIARMLGETTRPDFPERVPASVLRRFVTPTERVAEVMYVDLDDEHGPEAVVRGVRPADEFNITPGRVFILAFNAATEEWGRVFDTSAERIEAEHGSSTTTTTSTTVVSAPDGAPAAFASDGEVFFEGAQLDDLVVEPFWNPRSRTRDLLLSANPSLGTRPAQQVAIVRFQDEVATVVYGFEGTGSGTAAILDGGRVRVRTDLHASTDAGCCPTRKYTFVIAPRSEFGYGTYEAVEDDRPWLGVATAAYELLDEQGERDEVETTVVDVVPGSPASGRLEPGDVLLAVAAPGRPTPEGSDPFQSQLAARKAGDNVRLRFRRGGAEQVIAVRLASAIQLLRAGYHPSVAAMSWSLVTDDRGVVVKSVEGRAAAAGIAPGNVLVRVDGHTVADLVDVDRALLRRTFEPVEVVVHDGVGERTIRVEPHFSPAGYTSSLEIL